MKNTKLIKILISLIFMGFFFGIGFYNDEKLKGKSYFSINFFDIKLGDGILIKTPQNKIILIDGGDGDQMISKISKKMGFFEKKIDYIFLSHGDSDHISGLISIVKKFEVGKIFLLEYKKNTPYYEEFEKILKQKNIQKIFYKDSKKFFIEKNFLFIPIFPKNGDFDKIKNKRNFSGIFEMEIGKNRKKFLFTGDIEKNIEEFLIKNKRISDINYLKIAHHGSKSSSSTGFILASKPEFGIIGAALENKFGHPNQEVVSRFEKFGVKIFQTGKIGDIEFKIPK